MQMSKNIVAIFNEVCPDSGSQVVIVSRFPYQTFKIIRHIQLQLHRFIEKHNPESLQCILFIKKLVMI